MKSTVEPLENNLVKVSVEVDETEFDEAVNAAFKRIAKEVRLPGFRPGKAPRKVLEARLGKAAGREEAMREALPTYYSRAVIEHDVDVVASPEIDITGGQEDGAVTFDAVVEVRPVMTIDGYGDLTVEIPSPEVTDDDVDAQIDRLRSQFGEHVEVDRPIAEDDQIVIDIEGSHEGEVVDGLTHDDWSWQIGSYDQIPEIDENLLGASVGDVVEFSAEHPDEDEDEPLEFRIEVKAVKELTLPDADDEWAAEASEFDTLDDLRADLRSNLAEEKATHARNASIDETAKAVGELIDAETLSDALIDGEVDDQIQNFAMRLQSQGIEPAQWFQMTGTDPTGMREQFRDQAVSAVQVDLALRAIAEAEGLDVDDDEIDAEFAPVAEQFGQTVEAIRAQFAETGRLSAVRSDLRKRKALDWLVEQVTFVDPDGNAIDRADLAAPEADDDTPETDDETSEDAEESTE